MMRSPTLRSARLLRNAIQMPGPLAAADAWSIAMCQTGTCDRTGSGGQENRRVEVPR
jgi:hypothetical protein